MTWNNITIAALTLTLTACGGAQGPTGAPGEQGAQGAQGTAGDQGEAGAQGEVGMTGEAGDSIALMQVNLNGLIDLGPNAAYEGWVIVDGAPVSTGVFHVNPEGRQSISVFPVKSADLDAASLFVLTIEPVPDSDPAPSNTHILAGAFDGELAELSVGHPGALGNDYAAAEGAFILLTPSTAASDTDSRNGIWWVDPTTGPGSTFAQLPDLSALGWRYEGWVVGPNGPISTGVFAKGDEADSDGAGPTAGPDALFSPPFPGQDFITPALDLTSGYAAVLTIEPYPDNSPAPFGALKPLVDMDITFVQAPALQMMTNNAGSFPTGRALR